MARIRTIKPEYFRHEGLQALEADHPGAYPMLVFAGLWTVCDRTGRFPWRPRILKLDILPFLDFEMGSTLGLLEGAGFIQRYEADGETFGLIPGFERHQRITGTEAKGDPRYPEPELETLGKHSGSTLETLGNQPGNNLATTWQTGREKEGKGKGKGKGKEGSTSPSAPPADAGPSAPNGPPTLAWGMGIWREHCPTLPQPSSETAKRRRHWAARCREPGFVDRLPEVCRRIAASPFCRGETPGRSWVATWDWLTERPDSWRKVLEGAYDQRERGRDPDLDVGSHREQYQTPPDELERASREARSRADDLRRQGRVGEADHAEQSAFGLAVWARQARGQPEQAAIASVREEWGLGPAESSN